MVLYNLAGTADVRSTKKERNVSKSEGRRDGRDSRQIEIEIGDETRRHGENLHCLLSNRRDVILMFRKKEERKKERKERKERIEEVLRERNERERNNKGRVCDTAVP